MDQSDEIGRETKRTEEEIHKAEMREEIGKLKEEIDKKAREVSRGLVNGSGAPSATADED